MEYIAEGLARVNDLNGKKIVLYLAKKGDQECGRDQIARDLKLDITDQELADRLYKLDKADLIAPGSTGYHFKGLGDPIFAVIFKKHFSHEIERVTFEEVTDQFEQEMKTLKRKIAWQKGVAGEYRVMYHLLMAVARGAKPEDILVNPSPGFTLKGFKGGLQKKSFYGDQHQRDEVDIFGAAKNPEDLDLIVEVKAWDKPVSLEVVKEFIALKDRLTPKLERKTAFLLCADAGYTEAAGQAMLQNQIMYTTLQKIAGA